jgi:ribonuclease HII
MTLPNFDIENKYPDRVVVGIDEAGRGPLAGPVVAAAVIVDRNYIIPGINDSKKLSKRVREKLYQEITANYIYATGIISPQEIDRINILEATKAACAEAVEWIEDRIRHPELDSGSKQPVNEILNQVQDDGYSTAPFTFTCLIDGNMKFDDKRLISVIKGDSISYSIAAASIVAKVTRDNIMAQLAQEFPQYHWDQNSGYGTEKHLDAIARFGLTKHHRRSFKIKSSELILP